MLVLASPTLGEGLCSVPVLAHGCGSGDPNADRIEWTLLVWCRPLYILYYYIPVTIIGLRLQSTFFNDIFQPLFDLNCLKLRNLTFAHAHFVEFAMKQVNIPNTVLTISLLLEELDYKVNHNFFSYSGHYFSRGKTIHSHQHSLSLILSAFNGYRVSGALKFLKTKNLRVICPLLTVICWLCFCQFLSKSAFQCCILCAYLN